MLIQVWTIYNPHRTIGSSTLCAVGCGFDARREQNLYVCDEHHKNALCVIIYYKHIFTNYISMKSAIWLPITSHAKFGAR